jgi:hypothetical protein
MGRQGRSAKIEFGPFGADHFAGAQPLERRIPPMILPTLVKDKNGRFRASAGGYDCLRKGGCLRMLTTIGGVSPRHGGLPRDLRLNFAWRHREELRAAARALLAWKPDRVIFAHGRWHETNGAAELPRAF